MFYLNINYLHYMVSTKIIVVLLFFHVKDDT